jgi:hypothetical protein
VAARLEREPSFSSFDPTPKPTPAPPSRLAREPSFFNPTPPSASHILPGIAPGTAPAPPSGSPSPPSWVTTLPPDEPPDVSDPSPGKATLPSPAPLARKVSFEAGRPTPPGQAGRPGGGAVRRPPTVGAEADDPPNPFGVQLKKRRPPAGGVGRQLTGLGQAQGAGQEGTPLAPSQGSSASSPAPPGRELKREPTFHF